MTPCDEERAKDDAEAGRARVIRVVAVWQPLRVGGIQIGFRSRATAHPHADPLRMGAPPPDPASDVHREVASRVGLRFR
jgi:hypothetical protein